MYATTTTTTTTTKNSSGNKFTRVREGGGIFMKMRGTKMVINMKGKEMNGIHESGIALILMRSLSLRVGGTRTLSSVSGSNCYMYKTRGYK